MRQKLWGSTIREQHALLLVWERPLPDLLERCWECCIPSALTLVVHFCCVRLSLSCSVVWSRFLVSLWEQLFWQSWKFSALPFQYRGTGTNGLSTICLLVTSRLFLSHCWC